MDTGKREPMMDKKDPAERLDGSSEIEAIDAEMSERIKDVEKAARDWGVRPDHLEGKFVAAWLRAAKILSHLAVVFTVEIRKITGGAKEVAELELEKLRKYNVAAAMSIYQAQAAKELVIARVAEGLTNKLIDDSRDFLVLKQTDYNRRQAWKLAGIVSLCTLLLFGAGYELRAFQDEPATSALGKCAARPLHGTMSGESVILCRLDELSPRPLSAAPGALKEWMVSLFW